MTTPFDLERFRRLRKRPLPTRLMLLGAEMQASTLRTHRHQNGILHPDAPPPTGSAEPHYSLRSVYEAAVYAALNRLGINRGYARRAAELVDQFFEGDEAEKLREEAAYLVMGNRDDGARFPPAFMDHAKVDQAVTSPRTRSLVLLNVQSLFNACDERIDAEIQFGPGGSE